MQGGKIMRLNYSNGYYDGDVNSQNVPHGQGIFYWNSGDTYTGKWENGSMNGYGVFKSQVGDRYEGYFVNGERHGRGQYVRSAGDVYIGDWKNNKRNGNGKEIHPDGSYYDGEWKDDKANGFGKFCVNHEIYYEGQWANDDWCGHGKFVNKGTTLIGTWSNSSNAVSVTCIQGLHQLHGKLVDGQFIPEEPKIVENRKGASGHYSVDKKYYDAIANDLGSYKYFVFEGRRIYYKDGLFPFSNANIAMMQRGAAPIGIDGHKVELHHTIQTNDGPLMEILYTTHKGYYKTLHSPTEYSDINRSHFNNVEKPNYWKFRVEQYLKNH